MLYIYIYIYTQTNSPLLQYRRYTYGRIQVVCISIDNCADFFLEQEADLVQLKERVHLLQHLHGYWTFMMSGTAAILLVCVREDYDTFFV